MLDPPKPLPADEKTLIEAWHGPHSTAAIAANLGIKGDALERAFRKLKQEGKLPRLSRQAVHQAPASSDRPAAGSTCVSRPEPTPRPCTRFTRFCVKRLAATD